MEGTYARNPTWMFKTHDIYVSNIYFEAKRPLTSQNKSW